MKTQVARPNRIINRILFSNTCSKTGASACFMTPRIPEAEEYRWRIFEIEDNLNASLVIKPLLSSCLVRFELLFLNTDPCF
jgi:hypothetical protein